MSVRMKMTHSKTASRRAHHRTGTPRLVATKTGVRRRHFVDPATGMYRGKQIITIGDATKEKAAKSSKKTAKKPASKDASPDTASEAKNDSTDK